MKNFKQRIERLKGKMGNIDERNPYADCTDGELLELAAEVVADAEAHPENYLDRDDVALLAQIAKLNRGHAPQGVSHAT